MLHCSISQPWVNKPAVDFTYLCVPCLSADRRPDLLPSPIDWETRISRQTPSPVFTLLKSPPLQNQFFHQPFWWAPSSGLWKNRSVLPLSASLLLREAQKGKPMSSPPCYPPFRAPFMLPWALDTQAASVLSRSSKFGTGGPVWPGMSPNLSMDAWSVPSPNLLITSPPENWYPFQSPAVRGPTSKSTDLPNSEGFTCILVAVDWFSKACKLIPIRGLPTALETAEALFPPRLPQLWTPGRYRLRSWATINFPRMEGLPQTPSQLASPPDITPRPMARLSGWYRR